MLNWFYESTYHSVPSTQMRVQLRLNYRNADPREVVPPRPTAIEEWLGSATNNYQDEIQLMMDASFHFAGADVFVKVIEISDDWPSVGTVIAEQSK